MSEFFSCMNIGYMYFYLRYCSYRSKCISYCIAVMCKCPRINYNTINIIVISFLKLIYNCTLMVALEYLNFNIKFLCFLVNHINKRVIIIITIYSFFSYSKEINIRSVNNKYLHC